MARITVDFEKCKGCALCTSVCPKEIVTIQKNKRNSRGYFTATCIDSSKCIGCTMCAMMCPDCAIAVER